MEELISAILPQMPVVAVLLVVGMIVRADVNNHLTYLESLIDKLIEILTENKD